MRRVSVIGAGTIGASWAAYFLARGFEVAGYDPAPNGEAFARRFIDTAWPTLEKLNVVQAGADRKRFRVFQGSGGGHQRRGVRPGKRARTRRSQDRTVRNAGRRPAPGRRDRDELLRSSHQPREHEVQTSGTLRDRPSIQSPSPHSAGRGCRGPEDVAGSDRQGDAILSRHRQAPDPHQERSEGPCRQSPAGGAMARSRPSRRRRCCFRRRCRRGDRLWPRPALGADGPASDISSWPAAKAA